MYTIYNYVTTFFSVVVIGCMHPDNWEYCISVHKWLFPYIEDARDFMQNEPYSTEKQYLNFDKNV